MTEKVIVKTTGMQGPRGKTIFNGNGAPSASLGLIGDFYYDKVTSNFYGPKLTNTSWSGATVITLGGGGGGGGAQGTQGIQGATGAIGAQGAQGRQGTTGTSGAQGIQGISGAASAQGTQGIQGIQGGGVSLQQVLEAISSNALTSTDDLPEGVQNLYFSAQNLAALLTAQPNFKSQGVQGTTGVQGVQGIQGPSGSSGANYAFYYPWDISQVTGPVDNVYSLEITHNLGFYPNVTVKASSGDVLETGIDYNNTNKITLTMAQPFSGTAYLS